MNTNILLAGKYFNKNLTGSLNYVAIIFKGLHRELAIQ